MSLYYYQIYLFIYNYVLARQTISLSFDEGNLLKYVQVLVLKKSNVSSKQIFTNLEHLFALHLSPRIVFFVKKNRICAYFTL